MQPQSNTTLVSTFVHWKVGNVCSTGLQRFSKHILSCLKAMFQVQQYTALNQFPTPRKLYILSLHVSHTPFTKDSSCIVISLHFLLFQQYMENGFHQLLDYTVKLFIMDFFLLEDHPQMNSYKIWMYTSFLKNIRK